MAALVSCRNLVHLSLPSTVCSPSDFSILHSPIPRNRAENPSKRTTANRDIISARKAALSRVVTSEKETIARLGRHTTKLRDITFVRHVIADDGVEYAVRYNVDVSPDRSALRPTLLNPVEIVSVRVSEASSGEMSARPILSPLKSLTVSLGQMWAITPAWKPFSANTHARHGAWLPRNDDGKKHAGEKSVISGRASDLAPLISHLFGYA